MSKRALRPRTSRPSYAALFEDEDGAGPSHLPGRDADDDSESDFQIPDAASSVEDPDEEDGSASDDALAHQSDSDMQDIIQTTVITSKSSGRTRKSPSKPHAPAGTILLGSGLSRNAGGKRVYALPTPSVNHRHRAVPLFIRTGQVERLIKEPKSIFEPLQIVPTNNFTSEHNVTYRLSKSWGYNIGPGPLWDLAEDRACFKEELEVEDNEMHTEATRRPQVYSDISVQDGWKILDESASAPYTPSSPPIRCFFGPHDSQSLVTMSIYETLYLSTLLPENQSHVFNAGGPVWGLDWCPIHPDDRPSRNYAQYLAVSTYPSAEHTPFIGSKVPRPSNASIQIWALSKNGSEGTEKAQIKCVMVLCIDIGCASELKWCPLPSHDFLSEESSAQRPRKMGLLAGTFEDGSVSVFVVPEPEDITPSEHDTSKPIYVSLPDPIIRIELVDTSCCTLDWANSEILAAGCTNGSVAVFDIAQALRTNTMPGDILPTYYTSIHQSAIRALSWIRVPPVNGSGEFNVNADPTVIATGGYDGILCLTDIREPHGNAMNRTRDVIIGMAYSGYAGGPVTMDGDNIVKAYAASPSMLGRGQIIAEADGPVWNLSASDYHPGLAIASADGTCLTTNLLRSTRRGNVVPFFVHKIYQIDYSRSTGQFRMLDNFLPQESKDRATTRPRTKGRHAKATGDPLEITSTGVWPTQVGIHRVVWNSGNGLGASGLLASGTASGMCRIDLLKGRWAKDSIPYTSVEKMRETGGDVEDDEDELFDE